jgi:hypothetical protein
MLPGPDAIVIELERAASAMRAGNRGEVVYADGSATAPAGRGRLVRRDRTRHL